MFDRRSHTITAAGLICVIILAGMLIRHALPLWTGTRVLLKVRPVDPRDLMRGDYVILGYPFDQVEIVDTPPAANGISSPVKVVARSDSLKQFNELQSGKELWLQLKSAEQADENGLVAHVAVSISDRPEPGELNLATRLTRQVYSGDDRLWSLHTSIDALFVQEHAGKPIEQAIRSGKSVYAEVYATSSGQARVADLIIEGKPVLKR